MWEIPLSWASPEAKWLKKKKQKKTPAGQCRRHTFDPWVGKIPWRRKWQPTPVLLPGQSHGQRSLVGYRWGRKESDRTEQLNTIMDTNEHKKNRFAKKKRKTGLLNHKTKQASLATKLWNRCQRHVPRQ